MIALGQNPADKYGSIIRTPGAAAPGSDTSGGGNTDESASSCTIEGVGWIICPVVNFLAGLADGSFKILSDSLLRIDVKLIDTSSGTYTAWTIMRNLANVVFVIIFLIIIFSQLTGYGVSNYGVKKMLPRLVVAAILVNVSFFICQLAVDLSNILGYSVKDALGGVGASIVDATGSGSTGVDLLSGGSFMDIAGGVLAIAAGGVIIYAMLSVFIPVVLAAVVALVMILFILIARQAIVVMLIVLSPLAFVAFLLPNTERLFKMWRKIFTAMLLLFPIIAIVFGLSSLASTILKVAFTGSVGDDDVANAWFGQIVAAAVLVLPLFVIPTLLKKSLDSVPVLGQMANRLSSKANANVGSKVKDSYRGSKFGRGRTVRKAAKEEFRNQQYAKSLTQDGKAGAIARVTAGGLSSLGLTKSQQAQKGAIVSSARSTVANAEAKELGDAMKVLDQDIATAQVSQGSSFNKDKFLMGVATSPTATETQKSAAMHQLASLGRDKQIRELQTQFRASGDTHSEENLNRAIQANGGALVGKAPDLIKGGAGPAFNTVTGDQMAGFSAGTAEVHVKHLEDLYTKATSPTATADDLKEFNVAMTSFNSAISDIRNNPTLQAKYGGDVGLTVRVVTPPNDRTIHLQSQAMTRPRCDCHHVRRAGGN